MGACSGSSVVKQIAKLSIAKKSPSACSFVRTQMSQILSVDLGLHVSEAQQIYLTGTNMVLVTYLEKNI